MPLRHGIEVTVTTTSFKPLTEYGFQNLGRSTDKSKIVSTRIEAKNNLQFYIRIQPQCPFPFNQDNSKDSSTFGVPNLIPKPNFSRVEYDLRYERRFNENTAIEEQDRDDDERTRAPVSSSVGPTSGGDRIELIPPMARRIGTAITSERITKDRTATRITRSAAKVNSLLSHPPFDLTASVYIDGHEKPEARQVIYLNPNHDKFYPNGFVFKGRWVTPPTAHASTALTSSNPSVHEAKISIRNWIFKSIPISVDTLTTRFMTICSTDETPTPILQSAEDRLLDDLTSDLSSNTLSADARPKPGQVEVRIRRIVAGPPNSSTPFRAYHYAGVDETSSTSNNDCTHTTSLRTQTDASGSEVKLRLNTVPWKPYNKGEDIFAKFIFNYTDRSKLVSLGLCDEDGVPTLEGSIPDPEALTANAGPRGTSVPTATAGLMGTLGNRKRAQEQCDDDDGSSHNASLSGSVSRPRLAGAVSDSFDLDVHDTTRKGRHGHADLTVNQDTLLHAKEPKNQRRKLGDSNKGG